MARLKLKDWWGIVKQTFVDFSDDNPWNYAAVISYYTIFSLPAVLIIVAKVAAFFLGDEAVTGQLFGQIRGIVGAKAAADVQEIVQAASRSDGGVLATVVGVATLIFSATTVFISLQDSLNAIWEVKAKPEKGWVKYIMNRVISFSTVISLGFLLLVSLVVDAALAFVQRYLERLLSDFGYYLVFALNVAVTLGVITTIFALMFKLLPDAKVRWKDVWVGAFGTTLLFVIGKYLIGLYLANSDVSGAYGAAGSIVLLLVWVNYSSLILLLGAEFTQTYARMTGSSIEPADHAVKVEVREVQRDSVNGPIVDEKPHAA